MYATQVPIIMYILVAVCMVNWVVLFILADLLLFKTKFAITVLVLDVNQ